MTEKRFLSYILTEGILLTILGITMLIIPKITSMTFGIMVCISFLIYGGYKAINAFLTRHYTKHFILDMILGIILLLLGFFLFMAPMFNLLLITSFIGVYFLLQSISSCAFAVQNRDTLYFWWINILIAILQFLIGLIVILGLPTTAFWFIGILVGLNFLITGITLVSIFISTKYIHNL